jgi:hypothetical protein
VIVADPVPLDGVTLIHGTVEVAVHGASLYVADRLRVRVSPPSGALHASGVTVKVFMPPACVTVTGCPATVTVPVRACTLGFAAAVSVTVPDPTPLAVLTVSQAAPDTAVHGASLTDAPIVTLCVPPLADTAHVVGVTVSVGVAPGCVTVTGCPATVTVPVRACTLGVAVAVNVTEPDPVHVAGEAVTQPADELVVHGASP